MDSTILEIQKQLKMIDNAKKAYTEETSRTMQQQRAIIQQLKVENQTMKDRLSKEAQVSLVLAGLCWLGILAALCGCCVHPREVSSQCREAWCTPGSTKQLRHSCMNGLTAAQRSWCWVLL